MGRIVNSFSYSPTDDQLINEIEIEAKRQGLDKSKLIIELLKVWYKEIKESGNKTSEPLDLSSIGNIINRKDDENKTETETISENKPTPEAVKACLIYCSKLLNPIVRESKYGYELNDVLAMLDILRNTVQRGEQIDLTREEQRIRSTRLRMQKKKREDKEEGAERERKRQHEQIKTEAQERKIKRVLEYESMSILPNADLEEEVIENEEEVIEE